MSQDPALNSVIIADVFSKRKSFDDYPADEYPCDGITEISNYVLSLNSDKRAVATGADSTNYSIFQVFRTPGNVQAFAKSIGIVAEMLINLAKPQTILMNQSIINNYMVLMIHRLVGSEITIMNGAYLHIWEKFSKRNPVLAEIPYKSVEKYDIINGSSGQFDMVIIFSDDIEGELDYAESIVNSVSPNGTLIISNSANQGTIYRSQDFTATPQSELHDFINLDSRFISYHIPFLTGISVFKRIS